MSAPLANSFFVRTPDEKTAVLDAYKKLDDDVVNSYQDLTGSGIDQAGKFGFMSKNQSANLLAAAKAQTGDTESAKDKVDGALDDSQGKSKSLLGDLVDKSKSVAASVKSNLNSVTGLLRGASTVYTTVNGITKAVQNGNMKDLRGISNTLNSITGRAGVLISANGPLTGVLTGLVGEAGTAGIQDSFKLVADSIQSSTTFANKGQAIYQVASGSLPGAVSRGDLNSVASMVDYIGNGSVSMLNPNAVKSLSKNNTTKYTPSQIGNGSQGSGQFYNYQGAYQKIDPNWRTSSWNPVGSTGSTADLSCLMDASSGTQDVFITGSKLSPNSDDKIYSFITAFGGQKLSVDNEISKRLPYSPAATSTNIYNKNVDPRLYDTVIY